MTIPKPRIAAGSVPHQPINLKKYLPKAKLRKTARKKKSNSIKFIVWNPHLS